MDMTKEERLMFAVESLRSARASRKEFAKDSENYAYWKKQCEYRRIYVQELEKMYNLKYYRLWNTKLR